MTPNINETQGEKLGENEEKFEKLIALQAAPRKYEIVYRNVIIIGYWHIGALYGLYLCLTSAKWQTLVLTYFSYLMSVVGITAGAHRLWTHKAYKATTPLQIILMLFTSLANQTSVLNWAREHRMHHKYTDTDADPHNAARGLFYSHIGWFFVRRHPDLIKRGKTIDLSDLHNNPILKFQERYEGILVAVFCYGLPTLIPMYFWGESLNVAFHVNMFRHVMFMNSSYLINSVAHKYGYKPYDKNILASQNIAATVLTLGEGFHNYHHVFPWDYRAAELGNNFLNWTTLFIDFFARIGWAYDMKTVSKDAIERTAKKTGDGTNLWGWGDKDMVKEDRDFAEIRYQKVE